MQPKKILIYVKIVLFCCVLILPLIGLNPFVWSQEVKADETGVDYLVDYATRLYLTGQIDEAVVEFKKILLIDPENISSKYYLNKIAKEHKQYKKINSDKKSVDNIQQLTEFNLIVDNETKVYQEMVNNLELQLTELRKNDKQGDIDSLNDIINEKDNVILHLDTKLKKLNEVLRLKDAKLEEYGQKDFTGKDEIKQLKEDLRAKENKINELVGEIDNHEKMNISAIDSLSERKEELRVGQIKQEELNQQIDRLVNEISSKNSDIEQLIDQNKEMEKNLKQISFNKEIEADGLTEIIKEKDEEIILNQRSLREEQAKNRDLADQLIVLEKKVAFLEKQLNEKSEQIKNDAQLISEQNKKISGLEENLLKIQEQIKAREIQQKDELQKLSESNNAFENKNNSLEEKVNELQANLSATKTELEKNNEKYADDIKNIEQDNNKAKEYAKNKHNQELKVLIDEMLGLKKKNEDQERVLDQNKKEIVRLENDKNGYSDQVLKLNNDLADFKRKFTEQEKKIAELKAFEVEGEFKNKKIDQLGRFIEEHKKVISDRDDEIKNLGRELGSINKELSKLRKEVTKEQSISNKTRNEFSAAQSDLKKQNENTRRYKEEIVQLKEQLSVQDGLMREIEKMPPSEHSGHINKLINRLGNAKSELKLLKSRYEEAMFQEQGATKGNEQLGKDGNGKSSRINLDQHSNDLNGSSLVQERIEYLKSRISVIRRKLQQHILDGKADVSFVHNALMINVSGDVLFASGSSELDHKSFSALDSVAQILDNEFENYRVSLIGHTDNQPIRFSKWKSNFELSVARALSVYHYFVNLNRLNPKRFSVTGKGGIDPIADNESSQGRLKNRRIEIVILPELLSDNSSVEFDELELLDKIRLQLE